MLSLINFLLDETSGAPKNPYNALKDALEKFILDQDLQTQRAILIDDVSNNLTTYMAALPTTNILQLTAIEGGVKTLAEYVDDPLGPGVEKVAAANAQLFKLLKERTVDDFLDTISVLIAGVTQQIMIGKLHTQLDALQGTIAMQNKDEPALINATGTWVADVDRITSLVGSSADRSKLKDDDLKALLDGAGWIDKIEVWMEIAKRNRMAMITPEDGSYPTDANDLDGNIISGGYTWVDNHDPEFKRSQELKHYQAPDQPCCQHNVPRKDLADAALARYRAGVSKSVDDSFQLHRDTIASWQTYIATLRELLPEPAPATAPHVAPDTKGAATPQGTAWRQGNRVRYAVALMNAKRPGPPGPWSDDYTVGATAGTILTTFPNAAHADSVKVYRQVAAGADPWPKENAGAHLIAILDAKDATGSWTDTTA